MVAWSRAGALVLALTLTACPSGVSLDDPPDVEWPFDNWNFSAVLIDPLHRDENARVEVELVDLGNNVWAIEPDGHGRFV